MAPTVYSLGSNGAGQLAIGHRNDVSTPTKCLFHDDENPPVTKPVSIAAGGNHTLIRYSNGAVYASGQSEDGRCGLPPVRAEDGDDSTGIEDTSFTTFHRVHFRSTSGDVIDTFADVSATWSASFFLTMDGVVYAAGTGFKGELGLGVIEAKSAGPMFTTSLITSAPSPTQVRFKGPKDVKIVRLVSGVNHTIAVSSDEVYGWGSARTGELGQQDSPVVNLPCKLPDIASGHSTLIACGMNFTSIFDPDDQNPYTLLGSHLRHPLRANVPNLKSNSGWSSMSASWNAVYLTNPQGRLLNWGRGERGQLTPERIASGAIGGGIKVLVAGSEHVLALGMDGIIRAWGWGEHGNTGHENGVSKSLKAGDCFEEEEIQNDPWNEMIIEGEDKCKPLGAGCATSWLVVDDE